ncbi:reverse transcriptase domain-containing protein, partial [Tanacetum coccineum]
MLFPFSLEGAARIWLEKEPPRSIQTWDDLVAKFINQFFPPSKTTNLRNEITNFKQRFDESFSEAWDRFKDLLRACPHHGFSELHQLDTFSFYFSKECIEAFNTLKKNLIEAPILIAPDWNKPFELMCDASNFALGTVLGQRHEKHFRPIHYASKTLNESESCYTTTEKEMLAVVLAVVYAFEKFRYYLVMNKCTVYTDHSALKYLFA